MAHFGEAQVILSVVVGYFLHLHAMNDRIYSLDF